MCDQYSYLSLLVTSGDETITKEGLGVWLTVNRQNSMLIHQWAAAQEFALPRHWQWLKVQVQFPTVVADSSHWVYIYVYLQTHV